MINATTNEIFITDGLQAMLLIMDYSGTIKKLYQLGKDFAQPKGITFSQQGEIFISNEGTKQPGNILKVEIEIDLFILSKEFRIFIFYKKLQWYWLKFMQADCHASSWHHPGAFDGWKRDCVFFTVLKIRIRKITGTKLGLLYTF